ncbi:MAG: D-glycero-beta-D-manno-heptose-7-phosphate kinase [candidate division Zixibacteria bacterium]
MTIDKMKAKSIIDNIGGNEIAVIGDVMLDEYLWGEVERISPEAPVPVVQINRESSSPGGAANVAANIIGLEDKPLLIGIVGNDSPASILDWLLREQGIDTAGLVTNPQRPTTIKTRIIAHNQQVVRADKEVRSDISEEMESRVMSLLDARKDGLKAIIISDYGKGMITKSLLKELIDFSLKEDIFIAVDPKDGNFPLYGKVSLITPNHHEAGRAFGLKITDEESLKTVGEGLMKKLDPLSILVTLGLKGMALFQRGSDLQIIPTMARKVYDVTGAGDTVIASFVSAIAAGASLEEATVISNQAAGVVVGEVGTAFITKSKLTNSFAESI